MLTHPTELELPPDELSTQFTRIRMTRCPNPRWHFRVAVRQDSRLGPGGETAPRRDAQLVPLALFQRDDSQIEIFGAWLEREIDPVDYLEGLVGPRGHKVVSKLSPRFASGVTGDILATWEHDGAEFAGRLFATKFGAQLVTGQCHVRGRASTQQAVAALDGEG